MIVPGSVNAMFFLAATGGGYVINQSLRFRSLNSANLTRTFGSPTSSSIWTYSSWVKRGALGSTQHLMGASTTTFFGFNSSDQLTLSLNGSTAFTSTAVFRDPTAWDHIVYQQNGSAQTCWVNGTSVATGTTAAAVFNTAISHTFGASNASNYFDGYVAEAYWVDGQALTPSSFGQTVTVGSDSYWVPRRYTGTYGANGFYLPFNDATSTTTISQDRSGNGNNWTSSGISVTSGSTLDQMLDSPTNNYTALNQIDNPGGNGGITNGNLQVATLTGDGHYRATMAMPTGKWYAECQLTALGGGAQAGIGIVDQSVAITAYPNTTALGYVYFSGGTRSNNNVTVAYGATWTTTDIIGVAFDADAGTLEFFKNGVSQGTAYSSIPSRNNMFCCLDGNASTSATFIWNFGQRAFAYTPPSGFSALCTTNLSSTAVTTSGSFTGNANADGPFVWIYGNPATLTINGNAVTFGTNADKIAGGFKLRTSSSSYNQAGTNNWTATAGNRFVGNNSAKTPNNAQGNP